MNPGWFGGVRVACCLVFLVVATCVPDATVSPSSHRRRKLGFVQGKGDMFVASFGR